MTSACVTDNYAPPQSHQNESYEAIVAKLTRYFGGKLKFCFIESEVEYYRVILDTLDSIVGATARGRYIDKLCKQACGVCFVIQDPFTQYNTRFKKRVGGVLMCEDCIVSKEAI